MSATAVKERPILFSGPMVRAILDGRKTQTRRSVKPQPVSVEGDESESEFLLDFPGNLRRHDGEKCSLICNVNMPLFCPYGQPGERLWVRETWAPIPDMKPSGYFSDPKWKSRTAWYAADNDKPMWGGNWKPSIHMPRWASRITLEIVSVRVERLQEISEEDAKAEGFTQAACEQAFLKAAQGEELQGDYWLEQEQTGNCDDRTFCWDCASKAKAELGEEWFICGSSNCARESDGPAYCDGCYRPINMSLTQYGIERELFMEGADDEREWRKRWPCEDKTTAAIAAMIAGGIGDLRDEHLGRLAQIGFATLWDSINGKGSWGVNPWVWAVEFKRCVS